MNRTESKNSARQTDELIAALRSTDDTVSAAACESAPKYGAEAVYPLSVELAGKDAEGSRKAKRALYRLVRHAGRPAAGKESELVELRLLEALNQPALSPGRRDLLWLISESGTARAVKAIEPLLYDRDLREDARCVLVRIPHRQAVTALKRALDKTQDEDFKYALADALRARGENVKGYPSRKMIPTASTTVVPLQTK